MPGHWVNGHFGNGEFPLRDCRFCNGPVMAVKDPMNREEWAICWFCGEEYIRIFDE